jgi:uncharacterized membrane protein YhhN
MIYMALKIALIICCALEFLFVPWFLKAMWPNPNKKSLLLKMICASLFVAIGVLSMYITDNFSTFAMMMLVGLMFGWIGDFFLHVNTTFICFCIGFANFLIGHIVYIAAYIKTLGVMFPEYNPINLVEIAALLVLSVIAILGSAKLKLKLPAKWMCFFIGLYFLILAIMFIKATALGYNYMCSGAAFGWCALAVLSLGSLSFLVSDVLIGIIMFSDRKKNYPLKIVNIVTYFVAQVLLASSILFVKG